MPKKQALVAVKDQHEGPWLIAHGYELAYHIEGLGDGEEIVMEWEELTLSGHQLGMPVIHTKDGSSSVLPPKGAKYRFVKTKGGIKQTSVTVEFR